MTWTSVTVPVMVPYVPPPPPPPVPPPSSVGLAECALCSALMRFGSEGAHLAWHRRNGLHGTYCDRVHDEELVEKAIDAGEDADGMTVRPCSCGVDDTKKEVE